MAIRVAVLGGGVAGLTAAHELIERGFKVTVFEAAETFGGKARSFDAPMTSAVIEALKVKVKYDGQEKPLQWDVRKPTDKGEVREEEAKLRASGHVLPSEHGFHYFPGFYRHVTDTLSRIPTGPVALRTPTVADNLVFGTRVLIARQNPPSELSFRRTIQSSSDAWSLAKSFASLGLPPQEVALILAKIVELWSAPQSVWEGKLEKTTWWNFIEAEGKSEVYQTYFANIGVRSTVAMDPKRASARSIGRIVLRLISDLVLHSQGKGLAPDRWLNGPTNEVWIDPWRAYLEKQKVEFRPQLEVQSIRCTNDLISSVHFKGGDEIEFSVNPGADTFQYCVVALPLRPLSEIVARDESVTLWSSAPSLRRLKSLLKHNEWMLGMQFYLEEEVSLSPGGMFLKDSPWAITLVSQTQFWTKKTFKYGKKDTVKTVLSVIISDWGSPGDYHGLAARYATVEQVKDEVWRELKAHFNDTPTFPGGKNRALLKDEDLVGYRVNDWDFERCAWVNNEELFVNGVDSWENRPDVTTDVKNLFLAGDYVRTSTDLATMESANEAARLAVNAILFDAQSAERPCDVWPFEPVPAAATMAFAQALGGVAGDAARRALHASSSLVGKVASDWIMRRFR